MKKRTLGYSNYAHPGSIAPFNDVFNDSIPIFDGNRRVLQTDLHKKVDAVLFWGGTDIHPSIYGKHHHTLSQAQNYMSNRDVDELMAMTYCRQHGIPMIGVCRGAQLGCAFAGGILVQHCEGHKTDHYIQTDSGNTVYATSEHHQMMNPAGTRHKLIAWAPIKRSSFYDGESGIDQIQMEKEPEIVYFHDIKMLAIQGHPEWCADGLDPFAMLCNQLIREYILEPEVVVA